MSVTIAIANPKGGSGKTATTFNLGSELARSGLKVLLVDSDPQGTLTDSFKVEFSEDQIYLEDIIATPKINPLEAPVKVGEETDLWLIPTTDALGSYEGTLRDKRENLVRLRDAVRKLKNQGFDFILIDPPGATDIFMASALAASDKVLIPIRPTDSDFTSLSHFKEAISGIESVNPQLEVRGILFNQVITSSKNKEIYRSFLKGDEWENLIMESSIRMATAVANAPGTGKDVISFQPKSKASEDYRNLAREVLKWQ